MARRGTRRRLCAAASAVDEIIRDPALHRNQLNCGVQDRRGSEEAERSMHAPTPDLPSKGVMVALVGHTMIYFSLDCKYVKKIKLYRLSLATAFKVIVLVNISFRK